MKKNERADLFSCFRMALLTILFFLLVHPGSAKTDEILEIPGTGDSQRLLKIISEKFMEKFPEYRVEIPESIGSGGGIKGLLQNRYLLARTARPLKAKEQDGLLIEYPFAVSPIVITTHPSVTDVKNITSNQIIGIYSGEITRWNQVGGSDNPIYPVDREAGDSSRIIFEEYMKGFKEMKSTAKVFYTTPDTLDAIKRHKFTIGFLPFSIAVSNGLNVLSIDGMVPTRETVLKKDYPYVSTFFLVSHIDPPGHVETFINYVYSSEIIQIIQKQGMIPVKKQGL